MKNQQNQLPAREWARKPSPSLKCLVAFLVGALMIAHGVQGYTMGARRTEFAALLKAGTRHGHSAYGAGDGSQLAS